MSYTPLHLAAQWNRKDPRVIAELLQYGAQVNVKDLVSNCCVIVYARGILLFITTSVHKSGAKGHGAH